jgi:hypothetical protein
MLRDKPTWDKPRVCHVLPRVRSTEPFSSTFPTTVRPIFTIVRPVLRQHFQSDIHSSQCQRQSTYFVLQALLGFQTLRRSFVPLFRLSVLLSDSTVSIFIVVISSFELFPVIGYSPLTSLTIDPYLMPSPSAMVRALSSSFESVTLLRCW